MSDLTLVIVVPNSYLSRSLKDSMGLFNTNLIFNYLPAMNEATPFVYKKILFITGDEKAKLFPTNSRYDIEKITTRITLKNELMSDLTLLNSFLLFNLPHLIQTQHYLTLNYYFNDAYSLSLKLASLSDIRYDYISGRVNNTLDACHNGYNTNPFISIKSKALGMFVSNFASNLLSTGLPLESFCPIDTFITSVILDDLLNRGFRMDHIGFKQLPSSGLLGLT